MNLTIQQLPPEEVLIVVEDSETEPGKKDVWLKPKRPEALPCVVEPKCLARGLTRLDFRTRSLFADLAIEGLGESWSVHDCRVACSKISDLGEDSCSLAGSEVNKGVCLVNFDPRRMAAVFFREKIPGLPRYKIHTLDALAQGIDGFLVGDLVGKAYLDEDGEILVFWPEAKGGDVP